MSIFTLKMTAAALMILDHIGLYQRDHRKGTLPLEGIAFSQVFYQFLPTLGPALQNFSATCRQASFRIWQ